MTGDGNHTYLLIGSDATATLVDAGVGDALHVSEIERHLSRSAASLAHVIVTHAHADHAAGAPRLASNHPGARFHKFPWPEADRRYPVRWEPLRDGDVLTTGGDPLVVLHTPGHSPDHIALWHSTSRSVFTGDLVTLGSSVMIEASRGGDLKSYLAALERVLSLDARRLLPAHGPEIDSPGVVLRQYIEHRNTRERQVKDALAAGYDTVQTIAESIYDGLAPALMPAARENVRAHLEKLKAEGAAFERHGRWTG
jgi:glyoxylase-like metal-dependent hydrolase (beta-lactamase superfamily II)